MSFKTAFQTVGQPVKINNPRAGFEPRTSWFKIPQATNLTQSHWTIQAHYINKLKYLSYGDNATFNSERDIWKKLSKSLIYCLVCTMWHVTCWSFVFGNFPLTWHSLQSLPSNDLSTELLPGCRIHCSLACPNAPCFPIRYHHMNILTKTRCTR